jgi:hypothetical protein
VMSTMPHEGNGRVGHPMRREPTRPSGPARIASWRYETPAILHGVWSRALVLIFGDAS